ncbi:MAG TPA: hypothetical protein PKC43_14425 [Phycisphaerales bacterium]|nr:hypothetical protein [Phycisphaerales bacterium]HMP38630.1 hypothetical protein [Phycisphaerales bacterium]
MTGQARSDLELVGAVNRGEREAFVARYERHKDFVHAAMARLGEVGVPGRERGADAE